jgi:hypothetical protein
MNLCVLEITALMSVTMYLARFFYRRRPLVRLRTLLNGSKLLRLGTDSLPDIRACMYSARYGWPYRQHGNAEESRLEKYPSTCSTSMKFLYRRSQITAHYLLT